MSDIWCQNKKCPQKKTQAQIRGNKGAKYYQSNKASSYYGQWCSTGCREAWFDQHKETCINAVGIIPKQTIGLEDSWFVDSVYQWYNNGENNYKYLLSNKLKGVKHTITREQAQTPEQIDRDYGWQTIDSDQAKELATQLGLTS